MSAVTAAESLGLGCCCVGYVRTADPRRISDMLGLPEGVSIVCGLTIGYPREMPDLKPKLPVEAVVHEGRYMPDEKLAPLLDRRPDRQRLGRPHSRLPPPFDGTRHRRVPRKADRTGEIDPDRLLGAARRKELQTASSAVFGMQDRDLDFAVSLCIAPSRSRTYTRFPSGPRLCRLKGMQAVYGTRRSHDKTMIY